MKPVGSANSNAMLYQPKSARKADEQENIENTNQSRKPDRNRGVNSKSRVKDTESGVYTRKSAKVSGIDALRQQNAQQLVQMIHDILNTQGRQGFIASRKLEKSILGLKDYLENGGTVTPEEQAAAAEAIADDGPWGVEAVSDRLVEMALKFADGDESKYEMMKGAIEAGFKAAETAWGGRLPDISYRTFEATMTKLASAFNQNITEESA